MFKSPKDKTFILLQTLQLQTIFKYISYFTLKLLKLILAVKDFYQTRGRDNKHPLFPIHIFL